MIEYDESILNNPEFIKKYNKEIEELQDFVCWLNDFRYKFKDTEVKPKAGLGVIYNRKENKYYISNDSVKKKVYIDFIKSYGFNNEVKNHLVTLSDVNNEVKIFQFMKNKLSNELQIGNFVTRTFIKKKLQVIYNELNIKKTAKGTDIAKYFEVKETASRVNNKLVKGFLIVDLI